MLAVRLSLTGCGDDDGKKNTNADTLALEMALMQDRNMTQRANSGSNFGGDNEARFEHPMTE